MGFKMNGSPAKLGNISGTAGYRSALKMKEEANAASALKQMEITAKEADIAMAKGPRKDDVYVINPTGTKSKIKGGSSGYTDLDTDNPNVKKLLATRWKKGDKASGGTLNELVAQRKGLDKGSSEYAAIQNQINKALGSKKVHTATAPATVAKPTKDEKIVAKQERKIDKVDIRKTKQEDKLAAKSPESDKGTKISAKERATIKGRKLRGKVTSDIKRGKTGLGSKIRKYRAARKTKKNIKKYGVTPTPDELL